MKIKRRALSLQSNEKSGESSARGRVATSAWGFRRRPKNVELVGLHEKSLHYKYKAGWERQGKVICHSWASPNCTRLEGKCIVKGTRDLVTMRTVGLRGQVAQKTVTFTGFQNKIRNVNVCRIQVAIHFELKVTKSRSAPGVLAFPA